MRSDALLLVDIYDSAIEILEFIKECDLHTFLRDRKLKRACLMNLLVIGEAANKVSKELKEKHPDLPWLSMIKMRNIGIHDYYRVNYEVIWSTLNADIPLLLEQIKEILRTDFNEIYKKIIT